MWHLSLTFRCTSEENLHLLVFHYSTMEKKSFRASNLFGGRSRKFQLMKPLCKYNTPTSTSQLTGHDNIRDSTPHIVLGNISLPSVCSLSRLPAFCQSSLLRAQTIAILPLLLFINKLREGKQYFKGVFFPPFLTQWMSDQKRICGWI